MSWAHNYHWQFLSGIISKSLMTEVQMTLSPVHLRTSFATRPSSCLITTHLGIILHGEKLNSVWWKQSYTNIHILNLKSVKKETLTSEMMNTFIWQKSFVVKRAIICFRLVEEVHLKGRWVERGFWVVAVPPVQPRPRHSPSLTAKKLRKEAPRIQPCTRGWVPWIPRCHKKPAGLWCSPHKCQRGWTSPHSAVFPSRCARQKRCVHSTEGTRKSYFRWYSCCSHCPCGWCSCRWCQCACPHHWCPPQSNVAPGRNSLWSEPGASSRSAREHLDTGVAMAWCWSPSCSLQSGAGTCGQCQGRSSTGRNLEKDRENQMRGFPSIGSKCFKQQRKTVRRSSEEISSVRRPFYLNVLLMQWSCWLEQLWPEQLSEPEVNI